MVIRLNKNIFILILGGVVLIFLWLIFSNSNPQTPKDLISNVLKKGQTGDTKVLTYLCENTRGGREDIENSMKNIFLNGIDLGKMRAGLSILTKTNDQLNLDDPVHLNEVKKIFDLPSYYGKAGVINSLSKLKTSFDYNQITDTFSLTDSSIGAIPSYLNQTFDKDFFNRNLNNLYKDRMDELKKDFIIHLFAGIKITDIKDISSSSIPNASTSIMNSLAEVSFDMFGKGNVAKVYRRMDGTLCITSSGLRMTEIY